jgi:hypothetical protein
MWARMPMRRCTTMRRARPLAPSIWMPFSAPAVIHAIGCGPLIEWRHIAHAIDAGLPGRVLVRTYEKAPTGWDADLAAYAPETVQKLADLGVS